MSAKTTRMHNRWVACIRLLKRIAMALGWVMITHWRYRTLKSSVRAKLGVELAEKSMPTKAERSLWKSSAEVMAAAILPAHRQMVRRRSMRLRSVLSKLQKLDHGKQYVLKTPAGIRVYSAAVARCWRAVTQQDIAADVFSSDQKGNIARTLISWLEKSGVERYDLVAAPRAVVTGKLLEDASTVPDELKTFQRCTEQEVREVQDNLLRTELDAAYDVADAELFAAMALHSLQHLGLAEALLKAKAAEEGTKLLIDG